MIIKPDDQVLDYYAYNQRIGVVERSREFLQVLQVLEGRSRPL